MNAVPGQTNRSTEEQRARPASRRRTTVVCVAVAAAVVGSVFGVAFAALSAGRAVDASNAHNRGVVLFVGDSNITLAAEAIEWATTWQDHHDNGYVPVFVSRVGSAIRTADCLKPVSCATYNFWQTKLGETFKRVQPNAIVTNLGINDTNTAGTATTPGYAAYDAKIDWFMHLLPKDEPVFWSNLPCTIEPPNRLTGCQTVNKALAQASSRWRNLIVIDWATAANTHAEYMFDEGTTTEVHYSAAGDVAWTRLVVKALDAHLAAPT